jgi:hypothetical protein
MSQSYGPNPGDRDSMITVLRGAVDAGVTFFDTAREPAKLTTCASRATTKNPGIATPRGAPAHAGRTG